MFGRVLQSAAAANGDDVDDVAAHRLAQALAHGVRAVLRLDHVPQHRLHGTAEALLPGLADLLPHQVVLPRRLGRQVEPVQGLFFFFERNKRFFTVFAAVDSRY